MSDEPTRWQWTLWACMFIGWWGGEFYGYWIRPTVSPTIGGLVIVAAIALPIVLARWIVRRWGGTDE